MKTDMCMDIKEKIRRLLKYTFFQVQTSKEKMKFGVDDHLTTRLMKNLIQCIQPLGVYSCQQQ